MMQMEFIEGAPGANKKMELEARSMNERWKYKKLNPMSVQMMRLEAATIYETSPEEAASRWEELKKGTLA